MDSACPTITPDDDTSHVIGELLDKVKTGRAETERLQAEVARLHDKYVQLEALCNKLSRKLQEGSQSSANIPVDDKQDAAIVPKPPSSNASVDATAQCPTEPDNITAPPEASTCATSSADQVSSFGAVVGSSTVLEEGSRPDMDSTMTQNPSDTSIPVPSASDSNKLLPKNSSEYFLITDLKAFIVRGDVREDLGEWKKVPKPSYYHRIHEVRVRMQDPSELKPFLKSSKWADQAFRDTIQVLQINIYVPDTLDDAFSRDWRYFCSTVRHQLLNLQNWNISFDRKFWCDQIYEEIHDNASLGFRGIEIFFKTELFTNVARTSRILQEIRFSTYQPGSDIQPSEPSFEVTEEDAALLRQFGEIAMRCVQDNVKDYATSDLRDIALVGDYWTATEKAQDAEQRLDERMAKHKKRELNLLKW